MERLSPDGDTSGDIYRALFEAIDEGYCLCEMLVDEEGAPVDYRFLEVNPLFEEMTGLHDPVGRTALELVPDLESEWVETYARAALGGERIRFQQGSEAMGRWFDVFAMPLGPDRCFGIVFKDETARREAEVALRRSEKRYRRMALRERRVSLRLQRALLPDSLGRHEHLRIDAHYRAGDHQMEVGGDWYDTIHWPSGEVAVVVGDVVGHDLDAAAAMGRLRAGSKAVALRSDPTPLAVIRALQDCASGAEGIDLATAFVAVFDAEGRRCAYAAAGHPPALLLHRGRARWLDDATNAVLGRHVDLPIDREGTAAFGPGSSLFLYTDGLVERRGRTIDDGLDRLLAVVERNGDSPGAGLPKAIAESLVASGKTEDDVIVVRIRWSDGD